jgi:hypothetical protein
MPINKYSKGLERLDSMKRKILIAIMLCFLICIAGCAEEKSTNSKIDYQNDTASKRQFGMNKRNTDIIREGNKSQIILSSGTIPNNIRIVGAKDEKNFYCCGADNKRVYIYNVDKKTKQILLSTVSSKKFIKTVSVNKKWVVWVEDEVEIEDDNSHDINWSTYAKNLETNEIIGLDKYKDIKLKPDSVSTRLEPYEFSLSEDKVVYDCYDVLSDKTTCAVIKMYDLSNKRVDIIDYNKNYKDSFYSHPKISDNYITWSLSKCNKSDYSEKGSAYIYNIDNKKKDLITLGTDILWPYINKNFIAARVKPNGQNENSSLVLYDLSKKDGWSYVVSPDSNIYKKEVHVEIGMPVIDGSYLVWQDNTNSNVAVYNCTDEKIYNITKKVGNDDRVGTIGIYNKVLFWFEDSPKKTVYKYAVLK